MDEFKMLNLLNRFAFLIEKDKLKKVKRLLKKELKKLKK